MNASSPFFPLNHSWLLHVTVLQQTLLLALTRAAQDIFSEVIFSLTRCQFSKLFFPTIICSDDDFSHQYSYPFFLQKKN